MAAGLGGWLLRGDHAALDAATERALKLFPRLRERLKTLAGSLAEGAPQMLTMAKTRSCQPKVLMNDEISLELSQQGGAETTQDVSGLEAHGVTGGVGERRTHHPRPSFASAVGNRGMTLYDVKELLGHASMVTTQRYAHLAPGRLMHAAAQAEAHYQLEEQVPTLLVPPLDPPKD